MEVRIRCAPLVAGFIRAWLEKVDWDIALRLGERGDEWRRDVLLYRVREADLPLLRYGEIARHYHAERQQIAASWMQWKVWERKVRPEDRGLASLAAYEYERWREYFSGRVPPVAAALALPGPDAVPGTADFRFFFTALAQRLGGVPPETLMEAVTRMRQAAWQRGESVDALVIGLAGRLRELPYRSDGRMLCSGGTVVELYGALRKALAADPGWRTGGGNRLQDMEREWRRGLES
jgi:hypothetical protein